jgi:hypothetical protein
MASRAHLLSGLRTGGPRSSSPFEENGSDQGQVNQQHYNNSLPATMGSNTLKANAAPFTPGGRSSLPSAKQSKGPEGQGAAIRMQQVLAAASNFQRQASPGLLDGQSDYAALYGASQGQPQQKSDYQQQEMAHLIRQKQNQILQNQMLAQQQQQQVSFTITQMRCVFLY